MEEGIVAVVFFFFVSFIHLKKSKVVRATLLIYNVHLEKERSVCKMVRF